MMFELDSNAPNVFPSRYRSVAVSNDAPDLDEAALRERFIGRDAYMRTRFLVLRSGDAVALAEVATEGGEQLFSPIVDLRVLAGPEACVFLERPEIDVGIAAQFAALVDAHPNADCIVVEGRYSHVSFLLNPAPLRLRVLDIVPPAPSKLADQAQRVLDVAEDLPPVDLQVEEIDSRELLQASDTSDATAVLLPCKTTGTDFDEASVSFLDQRPDRRDWVLLGCSRSEEIHEEFYGDRPERVDTCPRRFLTDDRDHVDPTLTRCCLLQEGQERNGRTTMVPWGASLAEVRDAIASVIETEGFVWTPT